MLDGSDSTYAGVRVFHGEVRSQEWVTARKAKTTAAPKHWWDTMGLLVTDSDPQYFCVSICFPEGENGG